MTQCNKCEGGQVLYHHVDYVTRDMAIDAGDMSMEGQPWDFGEQIIACECCDGEFQDCKNCKVELENNKSGDF